MELQGNYYPRQPQVAAPPPPALYDIPQPLPVVQPQSQWATGICYSCFNSSEDFSLWCLTCWCPCVTFGRIARIVNRGTTSGGTTYCLLCYFTGFEWIYTGANRSTLRSQYGLPNKPCPDLLLHFFCHKCALRQEYRELCHRGFDMKLEWNANVQRMQQQKAAAEGRNVPPTVQGGMTR